MPSRRSITCGPCTGTTIRPGSSIGSWGAGVPGIGEMLFELGVLHQRAGTVAAVADADDDELDTGLLGLLKVDAGLVFGDVDAEGGVLLDTVGVEVIELVVDGADAGDGVGGVLLIIIGLAVHGPPAGVGGTYKSGSYHTAFIIFSTSFFLDSHITLSSYLSKILLISFRFLF